MKNVTVEYILERFRLNPSGCNIKPDKEGFRFIEYLKGEIHAHIDITPEEASSVIKLWEGAEKK